MLSPEEPPSTTPASTSATSSIATLSSDKSTPSDPLLLILERLDSMQGRLSALEKGSTSVSSNEVNMTEATPTEGSERCRNSSRTVFAVTEEDEDAEEYRETRSKRARSLSPSSDKPSNSKDEEVDDDPSYRQVLASVRSLLDLPTPEEYTEGPSKIFGSKDRKTKTPILPMSLPPVEEINSRWTELEKKVAGNPSDNGEMLLSAPYTSDSFLPYTRPLIKFYRSSSSEFTTIAPKCQDSFKSVCSKSFTTPPSISVPTKQFITMEAVKREHVQMLGFVSMFIRAIEKCVTNMEDLLHSCFGSVDESFHKELEEVLSYIHVQLATISSTERALEIITEASMTMACNLELARRDTILKFCAPQLHEHDRNRLRRSGFTSTDLFSPSVLNSVENKYDRGRSPKRQKLDNRSSYTSRKSTSYGQSTNQSFSRGSFRGQGEYKSQQKAPQSTRGGRGGRRK